MSLNEFLRQANKAWHGVKLNQPDWNSWSHSLAFSAELQKEKLLFHLILNAYWEPIEYELPAGGGPWRRWIDTTLDSPEDIVEWQAAPPIPGQSYPAGPRSVVVLYTSISFHQNITVMNCFLLC